MGNFALIGAASGTVLGDHVKVQNNVSIYSGGVTEDEVFLDPSCVLPNVTNPRAEIDRHSLYETTIIKRGPTIGANATIVCGVTTGGYAFIGAGAMATFALPDYAFAMGCPSLNVML